MISAAAAQESEVEPPGRIRPGAGPPAGRRKETGSGHLDSSPERHDL